MFPKQICKRFLPDAGESRSNKTNMELEVCTSPGKHVPQERCSVCEYDQPTTPAEMVRSHRVVAHGYYVGARENQVSPGVMPEQTVGDNVGLW